MSASRCAVRSPMPHSAVTGRSPIVSIHVRRVSRATPAWLGEPRGRLGLQPGLADAHRAAESGLGPHPLLHRPGQLLGRRGDGPDEGFVPSPHLDHHGERPEGRHDPRRCRVVRRSVGREEHRVGALPGRQAERHARAHPEGSRLVGRGGHHLARPGGVPVTTDHHGPAGELGAPEDLHRGQELVEVDVEDPALLAPSSSVPDTTGHVRSNSCAARRTGGLRESPVAHGRVSLPDWSGRDRVSCSRRRWPQRPSRSMCRANSSAPWAGVSSDVSISTAYRACRWTVATCARVIPCGRSPLRFRGVSHLQRAPTEPTPPSGLWPRRGAQSFASGLVDDRLVDEHAQAGRAAGSDHPRRRRTQQPATTGPT